MSKRCQTDEIDRSIISPSASQDSQLVRYSISQLLVVGISVPQLIS